MAQRINLVPPSELSKGYILAERLDIPKVFELVRMVQARGNTPPDYAVHTQYTLGPGHVKFFYTRLAFLTARLVQIEQECARRKYKAAPIDFADVVLGIDHSWFGSWTPGIAAVAMSRASIRRRIDAAALKLAQRRQERRRYRGTWPHPPIAEQGEE